MPTKYWPDDFVDPQVRAIAAAVQSSDITFTGEDGMSNLDKMHYITEKLTHKGDDDSPADLLTEFPYQHIYDNGNGHTALAGQYMCDLRIQLLDRLINELYSANPIPLIKYKVANLMWLVRFREKVRLHNLSARIKDKTGEHATPTIH